MKEQMEVMMNALKGRVSSDLDDLVNRTDSPFITQVNSCPLPQKFRMPQLKSYDGVKDSLDHLETFKTMMHLQGVPDEIMCRAFPTTLKGATRIWFSRLTPNSIKTFKELSAQFTSHFIGGHRYKKSTACLMSIRQREGRCKKIESPGVTIRADQGRLVQKRFLSTLPKVSKPQ